MKDVIVGIVAALIGAMFCFRGYLAMRIIIPVWGALFGFFLGAGMVDAISGDGFLRTAVGWLVGIVVALVFGAIAYMYYEISILIGMAAIGFAIGASAMAALGVSWSWVLITVGIAVGAALAFFAMVADLPMALLTLLTATAGASTMVAGIMLIVGTVNLDDFDNGVTTEHVTDNKWWYVLYLALVIVGIVAQIRSTERMRASLREAWTVDGGRHLRASESAI